METKTERLIQRLQVGFSHNGNYIRDIEFLPSNGVAETIFTEKIPEKPYTWISKVITIATKSLGDIQVGQTARMEYAKTGGITVPPIVKEITLAEANTVLLEIHRTVWENLIKDQEVICKYCGHKFRMDIDLDNVQFSDEDKERLASQDEWSTLTVNLKTPFIFESIGARDKIFPEFDGREFNSLVFRIPLLGDALKQEKYFTNTIQFWRRIAMDCLVEVNYINDAGVVEESLPKEAIAMMGLTLFNQKLSAGDLKEVRNVLREGVPVIMFWYEEQCTSCKRMTPVTVEASNFFGD